jgi:phage/plasmid-associated DNA primase
MEVFGHDADRDRFERMDALNVVINPLQAFNPTHQQIARTVRKRYREEEDTAFDFCSQVSGHDPLRILVGTARRRAFAHPTVRGPTS